MPRLGWARCGLRCPLVSRAAAGLPREPSVGRPAGRRRRAAAGPGQGGAGRQGGSAPHPTPPRPVGAVAGPGAPRPGGGGGGAGARRSGEQGAGGGLAGGTTRLAFAFWAASPQPSTGLGPLLGQSRLFVLPQSKSQGGSRRKNKACFSKRKASTAVLASFNVESQAQQRKQNSSTLWQQRPQWENDGHGELP